VAGDRAPILDVTSGSCGIIGDRLPALLQAMARLLDLRGRSWQKVCKRCNNAGAS
jgi:hypothetical protein